MTSRRRRPPVLLLLLLLSSAAASFAECLPGQSSALLHLKRGFSFSHLSSSNLTSWLPGSDCCIGWEGVACDHRSSGMVTTLDLSRRFISGKVDASLFNLTALVSLDLSYNSFGPAPFPTAFDRLPELTYLNLSNAGFTGSIPMSLFSLPALEVLQLRQNQLSGHLGEFLNASSMLNTLDLSENVLEGEIPLSIFNLSGLEILTLGFNNFSGTLKLDLFGSFMNLSSLDLSNNMLSMQDGEGSSSLSLHKFVKLKLAACNLTEVPGFLRYQEMMRVLDLSNNRIGGAVPKWIWGIGNMRLNYLNLSHNLFTDVEEPLPEFSADSNLVSLYLHSNRLQGSIPLPPMYSIVLDYSNNNFSSSIPSNISSYLYFTEFFSLSNNNISGVIPLSICHVRYLEVLDLSNNYLNGSIPTCLMDGSTSLNVLNLRGNRIRGTLPQNVSNQCSLRTININRNQIEGKLPRSLYNCKMLEVLDVGNNHIVDTFPSWLSGLNNLRVLVLKSNEFYGHIGHPPKSNAGSNIFPMLQIFDISSNFFNGTLSSEFFTHLRAMMVVNSDAILASLGFRYINFNNSNYHNTNYQDMVTVMYKGKETTLVKILTIFTSIDLSNNRFEGSIPQTIGGLESLYVLNMSYNSFVGPIPQSFTELRQLESLDLSSNHISGEIPPGLTSLTFLAFLNLSYNSLVGRIPQGGQFQTFDTSAFDGNEGLCRTPLPKACNTSIATAAPSNGGNKANVIVLAIFAGSGFGIGFGVVLLVQMVQRKRSLRRVSSNPVR